MKILFLNAGYSSGLTGRGHHYVTRFWRYLFPSKKAWQRLGELISAHQADVVAFAEVDSGTLSRRHTHLSKLLKLKPYHAVHRNKYREKSWIKKFPILKHQCNAVLTADKPLEHGFSDFSKGGHPLIIRTKLSHDLTLFVVHLALKKSVRTHQLNELKSLLNKTDGRIILTGDFNTFGGSTEVTELVRACGLTSANSSNKPTFPTYKPRTELDYIFVNQSTRIKNFEILNEAISDHLPLLIEIE